MALRIRRNASTNDMAKPRNNAPVPPGQVNIIGQGTVIEGGVTANSDLRIAGTVNGNVNVDGKTVVTPEGEVNGEIRSTTGDIAGRVTGEVIIEERLILKESARVDGNLFTSKLVIEEGAVFSGSCDMSGALPAGKAAEPVRMLARAA
jgi:cytoskeletal protein CcmA (bactofilin family)